MASSSVMRRVSLRNLRAHKLRLFLTLFSIVLGTSFVAGSMVFTGSISKAFNDIFDSAAQGVAVEVTPPTGSHRECRTLSSINFGISARSSASTNSSSTTTA